MLQRILAALVLSLPVAGAQAQVIGLMRGVDDVSPGISLHYQNDAFGKTDRYYTQGVQLAVIYHRLAPVLSPLLLHFKRSDTYYGFALEHDAYTPTSILSDTILRGDRPYAATGAISLSSVSVNRTRHRALHNIIALGMIGPAMGGYEIQAGIHRNTNNDIPHGWQYQIANDLLATYTLTYEQNVLHAGRYLFVDALGGLTAGTWNDKAFAGIDVKAGRLQHPLFEAAGANWQCFLEDKAIIQLIGYDASLQGGLFNKYSPYTICAGDISRVTLTNTVSVNAGHRRVFISGDFTWLSPEFSTGKSHAWGGLRLSYRFK